MGSKISEELYEEEEACAHFGSLVPAFALANTSPPFAGECALLDRARLTAESRTDLRNAALELLERVINGRADTVSSDTEIQLGAPSGVLRRKEFLDPAVRACALRTLGETGLPEATHILSRFTPPAAGDDPGQLIWPAAQIALRECHLRSIGDSQSKIKFLKRRYLGLMIQYPILQ